MRPEDQRVLSLLEAVEQSPSLNQRDLAQHLGISLGMTNAYLQKVLKKGFLRATQVQPRRWLYFLTPQGALEKSRLSLSYLHRTLESFKELRRRTEEMLLRLEQQGVSGVHVCGGEDLSDIVQLCLAGSEIHLLSQIPEAQLRDSSQALPELRHSERLLLAVVEPDPQLLEALLARNLKESRDWIRFHS
jgi:DNA-binding MarR family transcriptional regulator